MYSTQQAVNLPAKSCLTLSLVEDQQLFTMFASGGWRKCELIRFAPVPLQQSELGSVYLRAGWIYTATIYAAYALLR